MSPSSSTSSLDYRMNKKSKRSQRFPEAVSVYLPSGTKKRLDDLPAEHGITPSTLMRLAILERLEKAEKGERVIG